MSSKLKHRLIASASLALLLAYPCVVHAQAPIGDLVSPDATVKGAVQTVSTGTRVMSGSSVNAGTGTAAIHLLRGGELRVCPRSTVSLTASASGRDLSVGMGTGGVETHYRVLAGTADTIVTPDFRILLAGPGTFDYAISSDSRGNTCVKSLGDAGASMIVSEIMGDGTYQVQPGEQVYFRRGSVANPGKTVPPDCGCPQPIATMNAASQPPQSAPVPAPAVPAVQNLAPAPNPNPQPTAEPMKVPANSPEAVFAAYGHSAPSAVTPGSKEEEIATSSPANGELHVQVDAPFVFRGDAPDSVPPPPQLATLRLVYLPSLISETQYSIVAPPTARKEAAAKGQTTKPSSKGFLGHIKSFFGSIFK